MEITRQQMDELRLGALTAIDGLWFMEAEAKYGFDEALSLDLEVWKRYGVIMMKRLAGMLGINLDPEDPPDMEIISFMMQTMSWIDGSACEGEVTGDDRIVFRINRCSWWENLQRSGREQHVPCEKIDDVIFRHWLKAIDPRIDFELTHSFPRGDSCCQWIIRRV